MRDIGYPSSNRVQCQSSEAIILFPAPTLRGSCRGRLALPGLVQREKAFTHATVHTVSSWLGTESISVEITLPGRQDMLNVDYRNTGSRSNPNPLFNSISFIFSYGREIMFAGRLEAGVEPMYVRHAWAMLGLRRLAYTRIYLEALCRNGSCRHIPMLKSGSYLPRVV